MYRRETIKKSPWISNGKKKKIDVDFIRVKTEADNQKSRNRKIEGTIYNVGVDFVDILQEDKCITTVLTDKIKTIKWIDPDCNENCSHDHHDRCRCINNKRHDNCKSNKHHDHCPHCHQNHSNHDSCCEPKFICFCDYVIPFCDDRIELRLAGLTDGVNFNLLRRKGCKAILELL